MSDYDALLERQRTYVTDFVRKCAEESRANEKEPRRAQNDKNWDYFHGSIDWSHKRPEDPRIHLHKVGVAAERIRAKFKQALMNYDKWISVERDYEQDSVLPAYAAKSLLTKQLERANAKTRISDAILCGALESRMCLKISGKYVTKPRFVSKAGKLVREERQVWQLDLPVLRFEQYLCDTINADDRLYEIEEGRVDHFRVLDMASEEQTPDKPLRLECVKELTPFAERAQEVSAKRAEGNELKMDQLKERNLNLIQNFYGTILATDGSIYEWQLANGELMPLRNIFCVVGNECELLLDPQRNKRWSAKAPFAKADPIRSPGTGRKAILDAGTDINQVEDELMSLMAAGALKSVHNITWYRKDWIADKKFLSGGIRDGDQVPIENSAPQNAVPMGVVQTGKVPQEAMLMHQMLGSVFAENVISNQIDLSGNLPGKQVRATEITSASTAISDVFDSLGSDIEDDFIEVIAEESFLEIIQHLDELDEDEVRSCFGSAQDKADQFLKMSPSQRFDECFGAFRFKGLGMRGLIANMAKAQSLINLTNMLAANPIMMSATESQISAAKLILEIAHDMGVEIEKIQPDAQERQMIQQKQLIREHALAQAEIMGRQTQGQSPGGSQSQGSQPSPVPTSGGQGM